MGLFSALKKGLEKTRNSIMGNISSVFSSYKEIDEDFYEELEEALILGDMGMETSMQVVENLRKKAKEQRLSTTEEVYELFKEEICRILETANPEIIVNGMTNVILVIGVNGVGKTTSIGKMGARLQRSGKKVLFCAADTFRAAAADQLEIWAQRSGAEIVRQHEGADPGSVLFDGIVAAKARGTDVVICDTAGRLHNKQNLMNELQKIRKIIDRELPDASVETLLVLDATTGQNGLIQAKTFKETAGLSGIVLTKMDGTAKGGICVAIADELKVPVKFIGLGEAIDDLEIFDADAYVNALV